MGKLVGRPKGNDVTVLVGKTHYKIVENYIQSKKPWPIEVMLANMNKFYERALEVESKIDQAKAAGQIEEDLKEEIALATVLRIRAQECAHRIAPYMHPSYSQIKIEGSTENPIKVLHAHAVMAKIEHKSEADLARLYTDLVAGVAVPELLADSQETEDQQSEKATAV